MGTPDNSVAGRLRSLERQVQTLRKDVAQSRAQRPAVRGSDRRLFLAQTVQIGGTYPPPGANSFPIRFIDPTLVGFLGMQEIWKYRYTAGDFYDSGSEDPLQGYNATGRGWIPEGALVGVLWQRPQPPAVGEYSMAEYWIVSVLRESHHHLQLRSWFSTDDDGSSTSGSFTYGPGEKINFTGPQIGFFPEPIGDPFHIDRADQAKGIQKFTDGTSYLTGFKCILPGTYLSGFQGLIGSPGTPGVVPSDAAPLGGMLTLGVQRNGEDTELRCGWPQDYAEDAYGNKTYKYEWVAATLPLILPADANLTLKNTSIYPLRVTNLTFWTMLIQQHA